LDRARAGEGQGLEELQRSVAIWRHVIVGEAYSAWALTGLAQAQAEPARRADALSSLDEALALAAATGCDWFSAETLRIRGELRAGNGDAGGVADIEAALEKARVQEARA